MTKVRPRKSSVALFSIAIICLCAAEALSQAVPQIPSQVAPGRQPDRPAPPPPTVDMDFTITAPQRAPAPGAASGLQITVNDIKLSGNTALGFEAFADLITPLVNTKVDANELLRLAEKVEGRYRDAGYILTRVFLPAQAVSDGRFTLQVVEGFIKSVSVEGASPSREYLIKQLTASLLTLRPLSLPELERALLLATDLPGITATGVLRPGEEVGSSELVVSVTERDFDFSASANNRGSRFTGPWSLVSEATAYNTAGLGEQLSLSVSGTPEFRQQRYVGLRYTQPTPLDGLVVGADASYSNGKPGFTLKALDAQTESQRISIRALYPIIRSRANTLNIESSVAASKSTVRLQGAGFSRDDVRVLETRLSYINQGFWSGTTLLTAAFSQGLDILDATQAGRMPGSGGGEGPGRAGVKPDFSKTSFGLRRVQPIVEDLSLSIDITGQYAMDILFSSEQFAIGGSRVGRGYEAAQYVGDHGIAAATELRYNIAIDDDYITSLQPYTFFDAGRVWNKSQAFGLPRSVTSTGVGVRAAFAEGFSLSLEYAQGLVVAPGQRARPEKIYLEFSYRF